MIERLIDSPTPMPVSLVVKKVWNRFGMTSSWKPEPVSDTSTSIMSSADAGVGDDELAPRRLRHRFQRVAEQVDQHLLDLHPVGEHEVGVGIEAEAKLHVLLARAGKAERAGFLDQLRQALDPLLGFAAGDEVAQAADDLAGAQRLLGGAIQRALDLRRVGIGAAGEQPPRSLHVVADRRQRLVELVGERGGHLAHRAQARDVDELGLQFLQPRLGLLMLGEVADEAGEIGLAAGLHLADRQMHRERRAVAALAGHDAADADDVRIAGASDSARCSRRGGCGRAPASGC